MGATQGAGLGLGLPEAGNRVNITAWRFEARQPEGRLTKPRHTKCGKRAGNLQFSFPGGSVLKNSPVNAGDTADAINGGLIPRSGRSLGRGHSNPLQSPCLENPMDRGA